jgi:hypothetical protein
MDTHKKVGSLFARHKLPKAEIKKILEEEHREQKSVESVLYEQQTHAEEQQTNQSQRRKLCAALHS